MNKAALIASLIWIAPGAPALAQSASAFPQSQFPAPYSREGNLEAARHRNAYWQRYHAFNVPPEWRPNFSPSVSGPWSAASVSVTQDYAELDQRGKPLWFDGPFIGDLDALVIMLLDQGKFDELDRLIADWTAGSERSADGRWRLERFIRALETRFERSSDWDKHADLFKRWKAKNPKSVGAAILEAEYWGQYAWHARGNGYAPSVSTEGADLFAERAKKAEKVLFGNKAIASGNPLWALAYMRIAAGLGWSIKEKAKLFAESVSRHSDFDPYYLWMAYSLTPAWGGNWEMVDQFAKQVAEATKAADGASMYARIYWHLLSFQRLEFDLFRDTRADWGRVKEGFKDINERYPHSAWNANAFAQFACAASDGETYRAERFRIGENIRPDAWPNNLSLDVCEHRFPRKPA